MRSSRNASKALLLTSLVPLALSACSGTRSTHARLPASDPHLNQPYVEGYLEYVGPSDRWVGPSSFLVHVVAKDLTIPEIAMRPDLFSGASMKLRAPAKEARNDWSGRGTRDQLGELARLLDAKEQPYFGCMYPIRVRLIRADGSVLDRQGCRGHELWPTTLSRTMSSLINTALRQGSRADRDVAGR